MNALAVWLYITVAKSCHAPQKQHLAAHRLPPHVRNHMETDYPPHLIITEGAGQLSCAVFQIRGNISCVKRTGQMEILSSFSVCHGTGQFGKQHFH